MSLKVKTKLDVYHFLIIKTLIPYLTSKGNRKINLPIQQIRYQWNIIARISRVIVLKDSSNVDNAVLLKLKFSLTCPTSEHIDIKSNNNKNGMV